MVCLWRLLAAILGRSKAKAALVSVFIPTVQCGVHSAMLHTMLGNSNVVVEWNTVLLNAIAQTRTGPTVAARSLAIVNTCTYNAWTAYEDRALPTLSTTVGHRPRSESNQENKSTAISYAAYRCLVDQFPTEKAQFGAELLSLDLDPNDSSTDLSKASGIGNVAAEDELNYRHNDGSNQLGDLHPGPYSDYTGYIPLNTPDLINDPDHWHRFECQTGMADS